MSEFGPFDPGEVARWAETYGHPEEWAQRAKAAHVRAERAEEQADLLADALAHFLYDLVFTAPQLGSRLADTMKALGYPKKGPHAERPLASDGEPDSETA